MGAGDLLQLFGAGGVGVVSVLLGIVVLFITGQLATKKQMADRDAQIADVKAQRDEWKKTAELERARSDANEATGRIVRDVMLGLRQATKGLDE